MPDQTSFKTLAQAQASHRDLLHHRTAEGVDEHLQSRASEFLQRASRLGVCIDGYKDRASLQTLLDYWVSVLFRAGEDVKDVLLDDFDLNRQPELADEDCPFAGLAGFTEKESQLFFGRRRVVDQLMDRIQADPVVVMVGRRGSGASSLAGAGVMPRVTRGDLSSIAQFKVLPLINPGTNPIETLPVALSKNSGTGEGHAGASGDKQALFLVVDSVDELFSLGASEPEQLEFMQSLEEFASGHEMRNRLLLVSSTRFRDQILDGYYSSTPWFRELFRRVFRIPPMSVQELRRVIEEPASQVGLRFEEGVVDDLLNDVYGEPSALPLLQFCLVRLWKHRVRNRINREAYDRLGGGRRALGNAGEGIWDSLDSGGREACQYILSSLVTLETAPAGGGDSSSGQLEPVLAQYFHSQRRTVSTLKEECSQPAKFDEVLTRLLDEGLLKPIEGHGSAVDEVELAHEALFHWQRYGGWLDAIRLELRNAERLEDLASEYTHHGQLLNGDTLAYARDCRLQVGRLALSPAVFEMIEASEKAIELAAEALQRQRHKKIRLGVVAASVLVISLSLTTWFYLSKFNNAVNAVESAGSSLLGSMEVIVGLTESSINSLSKGEDEAAERQIDDIRNIAAEASLDIKSFLESFSFRNIRVVALENASRAPALEIEVVRNLERIGFWGLAYDRHNKWLALARNNGTVQVVDLSKKPRSFSVVRVDPGQRANYARNDRSMEDTAIVNDVSFDQRGEYMAAGGVGGVVSVWLTSALTGSGDLDVAPQWVCRLPDADGAGRVYSIRLDNGSEGVRVAAGLDTDRVVIWDLQRQCTTPTPDTPVRTFEAAGDVYAIDWVPERNWLAAGSESGDVVVWSTAGQCGFSQDLPEECVIADISSPGGAVFSVDFNPVDCALDAPGGTCKLLTSHADRSLRLWDVGTNEEIATRRMGSTTLQLGTARYSPDGQWVAASSGSGSVLIWATDQSARNARQNLKPDFVAENLGGPVFGLVFVDTCLEPCIFGLAAGSFSGQITGVRLPRQPGDDPQ